MPPIFPAQGILNDAFSTKEPFGPPRSASPPNSSSRGADPSDRYWVWSPAEDLQNKASALSKEAVSELKKSSDAVQARTGPIELHSGKYYATCTLGGLIACVGFLAPPACPIVSHGLQGLTHTAMTPLDLVKCRRQVDPKMYHGTFEAWGKIGRAEGFRGVLTGWSPTFLGYSVRNGRPLWRLSFLIVADPRRLQVWRLRILQKPLLGSRRRRSSLPI